MNVQHTPGPWWSEGDAVLAMLPGGAVVEIARANVLQELRTEAEYANARLAAAAPEMLGALHNAAEFLQFYFTGPDARKNRSVEGDVNMAAEARIAVEVAMAALRKATTTV